MLVENWNKRFLLQNSATVVPHAETEMETAEDYAQQMMKPVLLDLARALLSQRPHNAWLFISQYAQRRVLEGGGAPIASSPLSSSSPSPAPLVSPSPALFGSPSPSPPNSSVSPLTSLSPPLRSCFSPPQRPCFPPSSPRGTFLRNGPPSGRNTQRLNTSRSGDTEDWVRRAGPPMAQRRLCPVCYSLRRDCHLLRLRFLTLAYDVFQLAKMPHWRLEPAIYRLRKRAIAASRVVVAAARSSDVNLAIFEGRYFALDRGADSSSSSLSSDTAASSEIDAMPDILDSQDIRWRPNPRSSVCAGGMSFSTVLNTSLPIFRKAQDEVTRIEECIANSYLFKYLVDANKCKLIEALKPLFVPRGTVVVRQGDCGDGMYLIDEGTLSVDRFCHKEKKHIRLVGPGDTFGEVALLYYSDRSATVTATTDCRLWFLHRDAFNILVRRAAIENRQRFENFLKSVPILRTLGLYSRGRLAEASDELSFAERSVVYEMGDTKADSFYIVVEGKALLKKPDSERVLGVADHFGEQSLIDDSARPETVTAFQGTLKVLAINRRVWRKIVGEPVRNVLEKSLQSLPETAGAD
eukprot:Gregarina_sp_Poly_1__1417@NODE_1352_length_4309_cov_559_908534_g906_i0_p1_GENE_NODE_1352_length_4309_cov_559_908534_g906_i0NODE_1352_length_4309_cov_559_908534_g906_i0_p1_ORF_typecomplete_len579_score109_88cNMP_binding/PF00027_29/2_1e21cNMP_binding/PF00027_29/7_7e10_NODE_1352_length_4309_cov_559_908534_g906_i021423878